MCDQNIKLSIKYRKRSFLCLKQKVKVGIKYELTIKHLFLRVFRISHIGYVKCNKGDALTETTSRRALVYGFN